ncbi:MAG TPA: oligosaccharide flippase family protein, partial [Acidobacteriota bacterium]|nr:oligosaccharide flippase family protein [Acidobacteriota bacterium]
MQGFLTNVATLSAASFASGLLNLVQAMFLARWLGPENFGLLALIISVPQFVFNLFDARTASAVIKYIGEFHARGDSARAVMMCQLGFLIDLGISLLTVTLVIILAPWASATIVGRPDFLGLMILYALAMIPRALRGTSHAVMVTLSKFALSARLEVSLAGLRTVLVLVAVLIGYGVAAVIVIQAIGLALTGILYAFLAKRLIQERWGSIWKPFRRRMLSERLGEIFRFLGFSEWSAFMGMISGQLDLLLLGYFHGATQVGHYRVAKSLAASLSYLVKPLQQVTYPELVNLFSREGMERSWLRSRRLATSLGFPLGLAALAGVLLLPWVLPLLVGSDYLSAVPSAQIMVGGASIWLFLFWLRPLYYSSGRIKSWTLIGTMALVVSLPLLIVLLPAWGSLGAATWFAVMNLSAGIG